MYSLRPRHIYSDILATCIHNSVSFSTAIYEFWILQGSTFLYRHCADDVAGSKTTLAALSNGHQLAISQNLISSNRKCVLFKDIFFAFKIREEKLCYCQGLVINQGCKPGSMKKSEIIQ